MPASDSAIISEVTIRRVRREDVPAIVRLLAGDQLGATRANTSEPLVAAYWEAFDELDADPRQQLIVAELHGAVAGARRGQIEGVRVDSKWRSRGIGERMVRHAAGIARESGCRLLQLTSNLARVDAKRFYERLGFVASHTGMKMEL